MMHYVNAEMWKLTKKVTAVHACVLMSGAFLGERNKDAKIGIESDQFEIGNFVTRNPRGARFPQICQRLAASSQRLCVSKNKVL